VIICARVRVVATCLEQFVVAVQLVLISTIVTINMGLESTHIPYITTSERNLDTDGVSILNTITRETDR